MDANRPSDRGHGVAAEPDRISARTVIGFAVILTVLGVAALILMATLFQAFETRAQEKDTVSLDAAGFQRNPESPPPVPRLQIHPARHWLDFREAETQRLESYGWMDRATGAVHIPIERAIDLVAERGVGPLPAAPMAMPAPAAAPTPAAPEGKK